MSVSFTADRKELLAAVEDAGRGCATGGHVAIIRGLLVETESAQVHFTGTDLDISVVTSCPAVVKGSKEPSSFMIEDTRKAAAMLKTLDDGPVTVASGKESVTFSQDGATLRLGVAEVADFPKVRNVVKVATSFEIRTFDFLSVWKRVGKMYSNDESRPVLTAVRIEAGEKHHVSFQATDSYRLGFDWTQAKSTGTGAALVRGGTLELVARLAKRDPDGIISFTIDDENNRAAIEVDGIFITTRTIDGQFPDVDRLIPDNFEGEFDIDGAAAVKACRRIEKLKGTKSMVRLALPVSGGKLRLYTMDEKIVDTDQEISAPRATGSPGFDIGLNPGFFADSIESMGGEIVTVKYISPLRPILVVNDKEDAGVLQMPIKIAQ